MKLKTIIEAKYHGHTDDYYTYAVNKGTDHYAYFVVKSSDRKQAIKKTYEALEREFADVGLFKQLEWLNVYFVDEWKDEINFGGGDMESFEDQVDTARNDPNYENGDAILVDHGS